MKIIRVEASSSYDIIIGENILPEAGERIRSLPDVRQAVIVSDDLVFPLYGKVVSESLEAAGIYTESYVFPHGENSKSLSVYEQVMEYLCACHLTRSDALIALGGGVTGDLTGFAAATYQRGIRFIQIPTTLLAAVDSSVGGKTAVNLSGGKNQAGCFYQPSLVLCDTQTLHTLPETEYRNGCAEVIKYGMIKDPVFLKNLSRKPAKDWIQEVISICVGMKRDVVMKDEFDRGERMLLNFGHTLGHGVEKCSNYQIPHGFAVAMGMAEITRCAEKNGICESGTAKFLEQILQQYGLPVEMPFAKEQILEAARSDKKGYGDMIRIIVPTAAGHCVIQKLPVQELGKWMRNA